MKTIAPPPDGNVFAGTFGGMCFSVFSNIFVEDMLRTAILAVLGAVVSFFVSLFLKKLLLSKKKN